MFEQSQLLTGMDVYTYASRGVSVGQSVTIRLWPASGDDWDLQQPIYDFTSTAQAVDNLGIGSFATLVRVHAAFATPISLNAGTRYTIGMSGTTDDIGLALFRGRPGGNDSIVSYGGPDFIGVEANRESAFRLHVGAVPEPSTYALLIAGLGLVAFVAGRRKQQQPTT